MTQAGENTGSARQFLPLEQIYRLVEEHRASGRLDEAEGLIRQVLDSRPNEPQAVHYLGILAHQRGKLTQAIEYVKRAVELAPKAALFQANLGEMYRLSGRPDLAIQHGERAVALQPDYAEALSNVGIAYYEQKDYEKALASHKRAVDLKPDFALAHSNMGNALHALRRFEEAVACYRRAVSFKPDFADGWSNLGTSLHHSGHYDEAISCLRRAIALDPNNANAHSGLGILLLMRGDLAEGWVEYEWRLKSTEVRLPYHPQRPWRGESLKGRRIYIHAEQGFGDTIQFARYVPLLAARGAAVTFRVQQGLAGLLRQSLPGIEVLGDRGAPVAVADCECALLSLPHIFGTRLETIPAIVPYLRADEAEAARWRERFKDLRRAQGGSCLGGQPRTRQRHAALDRAFRIGGGFPSAGRFLRQPPSRIASCRPRAASGSEDPRYFGRAGGLGATAAAMAALDLVITIDSAVVASGGCAGQARLAVHAMGVRLALAFGPRGQSVVSDRCGCSARSKARTGAKSPRASHPSLPRRPRATPRR